jgi:hypothetical protein
MTDLFSSLKQKDEGIGCGLPLGYLNHIHCQKATGLRSIFSLFSSILMAEKYPSSVTSISQPSLTDANRGTLKQIHLDAIFEK